MPAHAAFFSVYELARVKFYINDEEHHPYLFALTGAVATFLHDLIMTPIDGNIFLLIWKNIIKSLNDYTNNISFFWNEFENYWIIILRLRII